MTFAKTSSHIHLCSKVTLQIPRIRMWTFGGGLFQPTILAKIKFKCITNSLQPTLMSLSCTWLVSLICFSNCEIYIRKYSNFRLSHLPMKHFSSFEICFPKHYETKLRNSFYFKSRNLSFSSMVIVPSEHKVNTGHIKLTLSIFKIFFSLLLHVNEQIICSLIKTLLAYRIQVFDFRIYSRLGKPGSSNKLTKQSNCHHNIACSKYHLIKTTCSNLI